MRTLVFITLLALAAPLRAQDLSDLFDDEETVDYAYATFKTSRVILGQSVENPADGNLLFVISHHFGSFSLGAYEAFGLDQATMRLGFEYGLGERLALGIGRSTYGKTGDAFFKFKILRQSTGARNMPVSLSWYSDMSVNGLKWADPERVNYFTSRMAYTHSLLLARKFSNSFSFQVSPTVVHRNLVASTQDPHDIFATGLGARLKVTNRTTLNAEYWYVLPGQLGSGYRNSLSLGVDIETGGHVFQLHLSNSKPMFPSAFITETNGSWDAGDIYFGFNISRIFTVKRPEDFR